MCGCPKVCMRHFLIGLILLHLRTPVAVKRVRCPVLTGPLETMMPPWEVEATFRGPNFHLTPALLQTADRAGRLKRVRCPVLTGPLETMMPPWEVEASFRGPNIRCREKVG